MSALRVGTRVRIVRAYHPEHLGLETRIRAFGDFRGRYNNTFLLMSIELEARDSKGRHLCANPEQLEPILPEGAAPAKWEECVWQPGHVRVAEHLKEEA